MASKEEEKVKMEDGPSSADEDQAPDDDFAEADASASEYEEEEEDGEEYGTDEEAPEDVRSNLVFLLYLTSRRGLVYLISIFLYFFGLVLQRSSLGNGWICWSTRACHLNSDIVSKLLVFCCICRYLTMKKRRRWLAKRRLV